MSFGIISSSAIQKKGEVWGKMVNYFSKKPFFIMQKTPFEPSYGYFSNSSVIAQNQIKVSNLEF